MISYKQWMWTPWFEAPPCCGGKCPIPFPHQQSNMTHNLTSASEKVWVFDKKLKPRRWLQRIRLWRCILGRTIPSPILQTQSRLIPTLISPRFKVIEEFWVVPVVSQKEKVKIITSGGHMIIIHPGECCVCMLSIWLGKEKLKWEEDLWNQQLFPHQLQPPSTWAEV